LGRIAPAEGNTDSENGFISPYHPVAVAVAGAGLPPRFDLARRDAEQGEEAEHGASS
jgi:hypothetical protein